MRTDKPEFDAALYKQAARDQWNSSAAAWQKNHGMLAVWLSDATEQMLDLAGIAEGKNVIDIAAGAGQQTLAAARRIGKTGRILATDLSPKILEFAKENAKTAGYTNVDTMELDGEKLDSLPEAAFDAAICRLGLMLFPNPEKALSGMRHVLKDGGKAAVIVFSIPDKNAFLAIPGSVIMRRANMPPPAEGLPGLFSMAKPGRLENAMKSAGFRTVETVLWQGHAKAPSCSEFLRFMSESAGAVKQMMASMPEREQRAAWEEMGEKLRVFENQQGFEAPCELIIGVGTK